MVFLSLFAVVIAIGTTIFLYAKWIGTYWERRGLYTYRKKNKTENMNESAYKDFKAKGIKHGGYISYYRPYFMSIDLNVIKAILVKDADHFTNRGLFSNPKIDPFSNTLPKLESEQWKNVRSIVSPIFSSGM